jgi:hypothetical protein
MIGATSFVNVTEGLFAVSDVLVIKKPARTKAVSAANLVTYRIFSLLELV